MQEATLCGTLQIHILMPLAELETSHPERPWQGWEPGLLDSIPGAVEGSGV